MKATYDIIIVGGGMVGSTLACLLAAHYKKDARQSTRRIAIIEAFEPQPFNDSAPYGLRVSAISRFSQQVLQQAGAWGNIENKRTSPY